jgi:hypothetical protein
VGEIGVGWVAEPEHWSALQPGDVLELGTSLVMFAGSGSHEGRRWLQVTRSGSDLEGHWADEPDPLVMVLRRRDVLVGEVIAQ